MSKIVKDLLKTEYSISHLLGTDNDLMTFHIHESFEIYLSISGGEHFTINDRIYKINPRDLFIINSNEVHSTSDLKDQVYERYCIWFKKDFISKYSSKDTDILNHFYNFKNFKSSKFNLDRNQFRKLVDLIEKYENTVKSDYIGQEIARDFHFIEILIYIVNLLNLHDYDMNDISNSENYNSIIKPILDHINANLSEPLFLDDISKVINVSKYYMCKLFKEYTGISIKQYILMKRISLAKSLLLKNNSVSDVCYMSGFNDYSHFIRTFKNSVGISPLKYRKSIN